jgi:hypothetical protein
VLSALFDRCLVAREKREKREYEMKATMVDRSSLTVSHKFDDHPRRPVTHDDKASYLSVRVLLFVSE